MEFRSFILCLSILFLSALHVQATTFQYCADDENYPVNVSAIELIPDPLKRPDMMAFKVSATTREAISRGKWVMKAEYFGLVVQEEIRNLCEEVSCPVTAGNVVLTCTRKLSSFTPTGLYTVDLTLKNEKDEPLFCITFDFKTVLVTMVFSD